MIDLTKCKQEVNKFGGSENKLTLIYNNRKYMVKFPDTVREQNNFLSYMNNVYSEDIGCKIFKKLGFDTQNTFLAKYTMRSGKVKTVVACEDFTQDGAPLVEFSKLALQNIDCGSIRTQAELDNIFDTIKNSREILDKREAIELFWDMFLVDGLINNRDRNLDNWGFLVDLNGNLFTAPIYDCGSSLSPLLTEEVMKERLNDTNIFKREEFNVYSCFRLKHKRILFHDILENPPDGLKTSLLKLAPIIHDYTRDINQIIEDTPDITELHKDYLKKGINLRFDKIISKAYIQNKSQNFSR